MPTVSGVRAGEAVGPVTVGIDDWLGEARKGNQPCRWPSLYRGVQRVSATRK